MREKKRFCQLGCVNRRGLQCQLGSCKVRQGESILCAAQVGRGLQEDAQEAIQLRFTNSALVSVLPESGRTETQRKVLGLPRGAH